MERTYIGNHESEETGWIRIGNVEEEHGLEWTLYSKAQPNSDGWDYVKVVAAGRAAKKANYWLSWNGRRFATGRDFVNLNQHRKALSDMVLSFMERIGHEN